MAKSKSKSKPKSQTTIEHSIDFYAHHSPFGANASFTLGRLGKGGGFGLELGRPASQDVFVAYNREGEQPRAIPFFEGWQPSQEAFAVEGSAAAQKKFYSDWHVYAADELRRDLAWGSDTWQGGDLTFKLLTPFYTVDDPQSAEARLTRLAVLPAILAQLEFDNSHSAKPAWVFFGIANKDGTGLRPLSASTGGRLLGIASETRYGLAASADENVEEVMPWDLNKVLTEGAGELHCLVKQGGLLMRVAPRKKATFTVALGFYRGGTVTSGVAARYYYTKHYANLEDVLATALEYAEDLAALAAERDQELRSSALNASQQFLIAHATRSYYGSSQLLLEGDKPLWVVNEGEYQMINTFDLTVDHLFFELIFHPWAVRNVLDQFADRYRYYDRTQDVNAGRAEHAGGISFTHDMGVCNQFTPPGTSSYERPDKPGCFSHMTHEQLVNWVLCASTYVVTQADIPWMTARQGVFAETLESLLARDHAVPSRRTGVMKYDSSRCAALGQEITTYDSLDASLGQSRGNLYLAVKTWAAYVSLEKIFTALGRKDLADTAAGMAKLSAATVAGKLDKKLKFIPAVFEAGNDSRIIPAVEALVFPFFQGDEKAVSPDGPYGKMIRALKTHIGTVLTPGVCIDSASGGWKMSSTSTNTWASKIGLCQFVVRQVLGMRFAKREAQWDSVHASWQQLGCADWAFTDQIRSTDGKDLGSRYYPRGVTSILWLME